jgi:hypothetical protein
VETSDVEQVWRFVRSSGSMRSSRKFGGNTMYVSTKLRRFSMDSHGSERWRVEI